MKAHIYSLDISCQKRWTFCSYFLCNHSVIWVSGWKLCVSKRILRAAETYCLTSRRVFWGPWLMSKSWISALRVVLFVESHAPRPYMWWNNKAIHRIIKIIALVKVCADHMACCWVSCLFSIPPYHAFLISIFRCGDMDVAKVVF